MAVKSPYPAELRKRAVRMIAEVRPDYSTEWAAINAVAAKLGIGTAETLRKWVRQAQIDEGQRLGTTTEEAEEVKRLRRENAELRRANEILKAAQAIHLFPLHRPPDDRRHRRLHRHGRRRAGQASVFILLSFDTFEGV
jgi:transposase